MLFEPARFESLESAPAQVLTLQDARQTRALGAALARVLGGGDFLGLIGDLGAGKTTLVQGLLRALDPQAQATSPTYTLINLYPVSRRLTLAHMDLYRLERFDDLEGIGYWEYIDQPTHLPCVEWLNTIPEAWPGQGVIVVLSHESGQRLAQLWASPSYLEAVAQIHQEWSRLCDSPDMLEDPPHD